LLVADILVIPISQRKQDFTTQAASTQGTFC
jgi:hypothetical protein